MQQQVVFPSGSVDYYFGGSIAELAKVCGIDDVVFVTDAHLASLYPLLFGKTRTLVVPAGEESKELGVIARLCSELVALSATRSTMLVGIGGGVVTDITGFLASVYMRGVKFGFVPTTLLAMADAAIGGKNGVNLGLNKNMIGTIRQPQFILYDSAVLHTLPDVEWSNGFAEIIKYGCLFDKVLFEELQSNTLEFYKTNGAKLDEVIRTCADWKNRTVVADESETGGRKLLNFGHTVAHAIEKQYGLAHGQAVAIGMVIACAISEQELGMAATVTKALREILQQYRLPTDFSFDVSVVMSILLADKKRNRDAIDYILLQDVGRAIVKPLGFKVIEEILKKYEGKDRTG